MKRLGAVVLLIWLAAISAAQVHEDHAHVPEPARAWIDPSLLGFSGLREAFNVHPAFVHFPVALFPSALLLYALGIALKRPSWLVAGRACLYLAAASTAITFVTGWQAQETFPHTARIHHMMMTHLRIGILIAALAAVLAVWSFFHREQRPQGAYMFLLLLAAAAYLVLQDGDLGSRMVYLEGASVKPAVSAITGDHDGRTHHEEESRNEAAPHHHAH